MCNLPWQLGSAKASRPTSTAVALDKPRRTCSASPSQATCGACCQASLTPRQESRFNLLPAADSDALWSHADTFDLIACTCHATWAHISTEHLLIWFRVSLSACWHLAHSLLSHTLVFRVGLPSLSAIACIVLLNQLLMTTVFPFPTHPTSNRAMQC